MIGLFRVPNRMEDLALFTRHLAGTMQARAPMPDILRAYGADGEGTPLALAAESLAERVESGVELAVAMEEYPKIFPRAYRRLVRLGEQSKTLGGVMEQMAGNLEEGLKTYEYFRRAAIYPLLITILLFLDLCFLLAKITPQFQAIFHQLGSGAPSTTFLLTNSSQTVFFLFGLLLLAPIAFLMATALGLRIRGFGYGRVHLQLPIVGPVLRKAETARFANNLALLLDNHLPLAESLGLLADSSENAYVRAAIEDLRDRYEKGEPLGDLIAAQPLFPASMAAMVAASEDQGGLARTLRGLGRFYAERTSHGLTVLREIFEPIMLLLIGLLVAFIMIAVYSPLFELPKHIR